MNGKIKLLFLIIIVLFFCCTIFFNANANDEEIIVSGETGRYRQSLSGLAAWEVVDDHLRPTSTRSVFAPNGLYASSTVLFDLLTVYTQANISNLFATTTLIDTGTITDLYFTNATGTNTLEVGDVFIPDMRLNGGTYRSVNDWWKLYVSAGRLTGGGITINDNQTFSIASGSGTIRPLDDDISQPVFFDWTASSTIDIATGTAEYIGIDYNAGNPIIVTKVNDNTWDLDTNFPLGSVTNQSGSLHQNENPWWVGDGLTNVIERFQADGYVVRDDYVGGLIIGVTGTRNPTLSSGTLWSRLTEFDITEKDCSVADTFWAWYRDGAGGWTRGDNASTSYSVLEYDDDSGTPTALSANRYANWWVWIDVHDDGELMLIYPQNQYTVLANAEQESIPVFPTSWYEHGILLGRILIKQNTDTAIQVQSVFSTVFSAAQAADHGNLSGLTDDDHSIYALLADTRGEQTFAGGVLFASATTSDSLYVGGNATVTKDLWVDGNTNLATTTISVNNGYLKVEDFLFDGGLLSGSLPALKFYSPNFPDIGGRVINVGGIENQLVIFQTTEEADAVPKITFASIDFADSLNIAEISYATTTHTFIFNGLDGGDVGVSINGNASTSATTTAQGFKGRNLISCDTIDTDANGEFICGSDAVGSGGGGSGFWTTTTAESFIYNTPVTNTVLIGANATTTEDDLDLEVIGSSLFGGLVTQTLGFLSNASSTVNSTLVVTEGITADVTGDLTGSASQLNSQAASYYLDWDNLTSRAATSTILALLDSDYRISMLNASTSNISTLNATTTVIDTLNVNTAITYPNGANCAAGSYPLGVDGSGAVEDCTDATTEIDTAISTHAGDDDAHQALVTLAGQDYLTLATQEITAGEIEPDDLAGSDFGDFTCDGATCTLDTTYLIADDYYATTTWAGGNNDLIVTGNATTTNHFSADSTLYVKDSKVGVGDASPDATLDVNGAMFVGDSTGHTAHAYGDDFVIDGSVHTGMSIISANNLATTNIYFGDADSTSKGRIQYHNNGDYMAFNTNGGEKVRITSDGYVGINNVAPTYELDVAGNIGMNQYLYHNGDANTYISYVDDGISFVTGDVSMFTLAEAAQDTIDINLAQNNIDFAISASGLADVFTIEGSTGNATITESLVVGKDGQNGTTTAQIGDTNVSGCLIMRDTGNDAWTYCYTDNGTMTCSTNSCL